MSNKKICVFLLIFGVLSGGWKLYGESDDNYKHHHLLFNLGAKFLSGELKDIFSDSLSPTPDSISGVSYGVEYDYYFTENFGVFLGYDFGSTISAYKEDYDPLALAHVSQIRGGINGRVNVFSSYQDFNVYLGVFAGISYGFFDFDSEYKSLFPPYVEWYFGPATGLGYSFGVKLEVVQTFFTYGSGLGMESWNFKYSEAPRGFSGQNFIVPIYRVRVLT